MLYWYMYKFPRHISSNMNKWAIIKWVSVLWDFSWFRKDSAFFFLFVSSKILMMSYAFLLNGNSMGRLCKVYENKGKPCENWYEQTVALQVVRQRSLALDKGTFPTASDHTQFLRTNLRSVLEYLCLDTSDRISYTWHWIQLSRNFRKHLTLF